MNTDHNALNALNAQVRGVNGTGESVNAKLSLGVFINGVDEIAQLAMYRNIGNRALASATYAGQRVIREREALERDADGVEKGFDLDRRNSEDQNGLREPPVGLENRKTALEELAGHVEIYETALHHCRRLGTNEYDLPQTPANRIGWVADQARRTLLGTKPQFGAHTTPSEKLAFAARISQAKADHQFWVRNSEEIISLIEDARAGVHVPTDDVDALDALDGVDAHQYAIQAGIGLQQARVRAELGLARFPATTMIGRRLISDIAVLEREVPKVIDFVDELEMAYTGEITATIMSGRNLLSTEAIAEAYQTAVNRAVDRAGDAMDAALKDAEREIAEMESK